MLGQSASAPSFANSSGSLGEGKVSTRPGRRPEADNFTGGLYASPSFSSLYNDPEDLEPGPGAYDVPQSFGYQQLSQHFSQPCSSLTAKHDKAWAKVMISKDHCDAIKARGTPGPGTYIPALVESQSRVRFGTSKRRPLSDTHFRAPGPVYDMPDSVEASLRARVKFSKATRFDSDNSSLSKGLSQTGPGQYEVSTVFDGGRLAKSFGASHRAYDKVRFPGSDRAEIGKVSPGPGPGLTFLQKSKSAPFSKATRLPADQSGKRAPGPGAYENHNRQYPGSRNTTTYSFGRPSAKGRIDWKQMRIMNCSLWGLQ